jgi:hypothetical protein
VFASADHQLLPSGGVTGKDIVEDIWDLFGFLRQPTIVLPNGQNLSLDPMQIAIAGTSSGGLLAYLGAMHVRPPPCRLLSMYGMGGNFFVRTTQSSSQPRRLPILQALLI